jgi:hypothetical protein
MKIQFEDKSYIEVQKSSQDNKLIISIASRDGNKLTSLSVELDKQQLLDMLEKA